MDERTLEALKGSIAKWEAIVAGRGHDDGARNCPLCKLFHFVVGTDRDRSIKCGGCPVREATGQGGCGGSPYDDYEEAVSSGESDEDITKVAREELKFLRGLLPQSATSSATAGEARE